MSINFSGILFVEVQLTARQKGKQTNKSNTHKTKD